MGIWAFFKKAFSDMKSNAKAHHEVDRANFAATKAESRASFEENRGHNSLRRAKEEGKRHWDDAHMTPSEREERAAREREEQIAAAEQRRAAAEERLARAKWKK